MKSLRPIRMWFAGTRHLWPKAACATLLLAGASQCQAQPANEVRTVDGKVNRLTTAPRGEIDGAILDNGTVLHWPPHMQDRFSKLTAEGDRVRVTGRNESGPEGDAHFEVETVTNVRLNATSTNPDFDQAPPPRPERGPRRHRREPPPPRRPVPERIDADDRAESSTIEGRVKRMMTAPRGEVDGALLEDGTLLHWPPHLEDSFGAIVKPGEKISATGRKETGPAGDLHFEVHVATNQRTSTQVENPDFADGTGPRGPRRPDARRAEPGNPPHPAENDRLRRLQELERQIEDMKRELNRLVRE